MAVWDGVADDRSPLVSSCLGVLNGCVSLFAVTSACFLLSSHVVGVAALAASGDGDNSMHLAGAGTGTPGEDELESLPPLERARRRKSMLPSR